MSKKEEFATLIDFANLNLELHLPTQREKERVIAFFQKHAPSVSQFVNAEDLPKLLPDFEAADSLGFYELLHKKIWFNTDAYGEFVDEAQFIRGTLLSYIVGEIKLYTLYELWKRIKSYPFAFWVTDEDGNPTFFPPEDDRTLSVEKITIIDNVHLIPKNRFFDIVPGKTLWEIHFSLLRFLKEKIPLRFCAAPDCLNLFIPAPQGSEQRFCSPKCRMRTYMKEHRSNVNHPSESMIQKRLAE